MSYKIAVATSDGINVDLTFGETEGFVIYEVEGLEYKNLGEVKFEDTSIGIGEQAAQCGSSCGSGTGCGHGSGCGETIPKLEIISDCRCLVCKKIGFRVQKQLEKKAIAAFDVDCEVSEALEKIVAYLDKVDNHRSLRRQINSQ